MSVDGVADRVRALDPGGTVVEAFRRPVAEYSDGDASAALQRLNARLAVLRKTLGYSLVTDSLPPMVVNGHVIRCTCITRTA